MDFLERTYYGNSLEQWLISLAIVVGSVVVARILYWFLSGIVRRMAASTQSQFDDLVVDTVHGPVICLVTLLGIWYGLSRLVLSDEVQEWIDLGVQFVLVLVLTWLVVRFFDAFFTAVLIPLASRTKNALDDHILPITQKAVKSIIWIFGIVLALDNAGQNVGALLAGLGIGGLALAMAAKDTVSNVFGGFTIFVDRPFVLKHRIRVAGFDGTVQEVGLRSTRIQTVDGTIVTMPNSKFTDTPVENVSLEPFRKIVVTLGLTYDTTPAQMQKAMDILKEICDRNEGVEKCTVFFAQFGDFSMNVQLVYHIKKEADIPTTQNDVNMAILERFNERKLEFAFPTRTVLNKQVDS